MDKVYVQVSLDQMAKSVCDFMGWDCYKDENYGWQFETGETEQIKNNPRRQGNLVYKLSDLRTSLDVILEVEEEVSEFGVWKEYVRNLRHVATDCGYASSISYGDVYKCATAGAETRLRAIYKTLKENGEI